MQTELAALAAQSDDALLNDYLNEAIQPIYFREFVSQAASHGLELAGDGTLGYRRTDRLNAEDEARLATVTPDPNRQEQYRDIVRNRSFRQALLCHAGAVKRETFTGEQLEPLYLEGTLRPQQGEIDFRPGAVVHFSGARGVRLSTGNGLLKAALEHLAAAWPAYVRYPELLTAAHGRVEAVRSASFDAAEAKQGEQSLVECCLNDMIAVHSDAQSFVPKVSAMPVAGRLARASRRQRGRDESPPRAGAPESARALDCRAWTAITRSLSLSKWPCQRQPPAS